MTEYNLMQLAENTGMMTYGCESNPLSYTIDYFHKIIIVIITIIIFQNSLQDIVNMSPDFSKMI